MHLLSSTRDRPNRKAIVTAAVAVPVDTPRTEAEVVRVVVVAPIGRARPVVAVGAYVVELAIPTVTGSRQEDLSAIRACEQAAVDTVEGSPD